MSAIGGAPESPAENAGGTGGQTAAGGADSAGSSGEGSIPSSGAGGDAGGNVPLARCNPTKPFNPPLFIPALAANQVYDATVAWDGLTLMIWGDRQFPHLLSATRSSLDSEFGPPTTDPRLQLAGDWLIQAQTPDVPTFTGDGLTLFAEYGGESALSVYSAKRVSLGDSFDVPQVAEDLKEFRFWFPSISYDGQTLYGLGEEDTHQRIVQSKKVAGVFTRPVPISATNNPATVSKPVVSKDERTLYFGSTRTDGTAKGNGDIWVSTRTSRDEDFGLPHAVDELNTAADEEQPIWVSSDGCDIVILRNQSLAMARRPK